MNRSWKIEYECPQCGAPVTLGESDRLFRCAYCRVKLYLMAEGPFRYYLRPKKGISTKIFYTPYWRFKGIYFSFHENEIRHRIIDSSVLALQSRAFPPSVGLRTQALKLSMVSPEVEGTFLSPELSYQTGALKIERQIKAFSGIKVNSLSFRTFVGERISLIYAPFFVEDGTLYDAIVGQPLESSLASAHQSQERGIPASGHPEGFQIKFISTLCPDCGNDLTGERDSVVLLCKSCESAWRASETGLIRSAFEVLPGGEKNLIYLPFWRMKTEIESIGLRSYADLVRMANLPAVVREEWEELDCYFWSPAFRIHPPLFLKLAKLMTLSFPGKAETTLPPEPLHPVTLLPEGAVESIKVNLLNLAVEKKEVSSQLADAKIHLEEPFLVYVPFIQSRRELVHPRLGFSFQRASLIMSAHL